MRSCQTGMICVWLLGSKQNPAPRCELCFAISVSPACCEKGLFGNLTFSKKRV